MIKRVAIDHTPLDELSLDIRCQFNEKQANNFLFTIKQTLALKGITGIFGHSGSGKSTLLRAIAGLNKDVTGEISFDNQCSKGAQTKITFLHSENKIFIPAEKRNISLIFQDSRLFPHLSVKENLLFAIKRRKKSSQQILNFEEIINLTSLTSLLESSVTQLSGGEQQRVALARALLVQPDLLLLDEPLSALDQHSKNTMLQMLKNIQQKLNIPMLYVSHSLDEIQQLADNLLVLTKGKVFAYGAIHQVIHQLNHQQLNQSHLAPNKQSQNLIHQQTSLTLQLTNTDQYKHDLSTEEKHGLTTYQLWLNDSSQDNTRDNRTVSNAEPIESQKIYLSSTLLNNKNGLLADKLRCFILASDISLSVTEPNDSSIVNQLSGVISQIESNEHQVLVSVQCPINLFNSQVLNSSKEPNNQQIFFASISSFSLHKLALDVGQTIYLQFKASAVRTFIS